jgi:hypothetical protein
VWWHCKNFAALDKLQGSNLNYFWHQEDDHTLTSKGFIWTYPGKEIGINNVIVMPENVMSLDELDGRKQDLLYKLNTCIELRSRVFLSDSGSSRSNFCPVIRRGSHLLAIK